ncbi:F-box domain and ankyrin repeat protein [Penicillium vulpinum]|nr:F-box domain and ankyrin repeat protein [Penicillium vulpinum]KAJ5971760.1 F-box domain and ankyrin repeat protein [Penicillium vulpinum]
MLDVLLEHFDTLRPESKSKICISNPETIHGAASKGDSGMLRKLLRRGGEVNAVDGQRRTALHLAASNWHERLPSYYSTTNPLIWLRWIKETARRSTQLRWVEISQW